jgi:hypothetical protein
MHVQSYLDFDQNELSNMSMMLDNQAPSDLAKQNEIFIEKIVISDLKAKDFFGGRSLREGDLLKDMQQALVIDPSMFTIVANSAKVEVFILTKYHVDFLSVKVAT